MPTYDIALRSCIGSRERQEDSADFRIYDDGAFLVLCDGMGGINAGDRASGECMRLILESADSLMSADESTLPDLLCEKVHESDVHVASMIDGDGDLLGCGTTLICAVIKGDRLYFTSVGDSRMYLLRGGDIQIMTEEHNYLSELMELVKSGEMTLEKAESHPKRELLTSYIGIGSVEKIHIPTAPVMLCDGDIILLCSDGLFKTLYDEDIARLILGSDDAESAVVTLITTIEELKLQRQDNTTMIVCKYKERI